MKQFSIFKLENFTGWDKIDELNDFSYPWEKEESPSTTFKAYYNQNYIHFRFVASGPKPLVFVDKNHKMEVVYSERVEIFFRSNDKMNPYYILEIDPYGRVLDYKAQLHRKFDRNWQWPEPLFIETAINNKNYTVEGKISLFVLKQLDLINNCQIQIGLYRGHCTELKEKKASIKWISWIDSKTSEPDFHVPSSFGILKLQ